MALTAKTRQRIGLIRGVHQGWNNYTYPEDGLIRTGLPIGTKMINDRQQAYRNVYEKSTWHWYVSIDFRRHITINGITLYSDYNIQNSDVNTSWIDGWINQQYVPDVTLTEGEVYFAEGNTGSADFNGRARYKVVYYNETYYDITVSASTTPVDGVQVGNIAIYDAETNTLLAGDTSVSKASGTRQYSATISTTEKSARFKIVATAVAGTSTSTKQTWHKSYFYDGITVKGTAIADSTVTFAESTATYTFSATDDTTPVVVNYGKKFAITIKNEASVASSSISYTRKRSTGNYVTTSISPISLSGAGTLYVENGRTFAVSATAASGYVFHTGAITSSASGYGTINGSGTTSVSGSKVCNAATTLTIKGTQFKITPAIATSAQSSWGTPTINGSSAAVVLKPNTTYTLGFTSSTASTYAPTVNYWNVGGETCSTSFTTGDVISSNITAYLYLTQTKWQLTVANGTNSSWGNVYLGATGTATTGWYAKDTNVTVRFVSALGSTIAPTAYQINYNGVTSNCSNTATIKTTNASLTATMYLKQTRWLMGLAYGASGTNEWGTLAFKRHSDTTWTTGTSDKIYVTTGDQVDLKFTPSASLATTIHPQVDHWTFLMQTSTPTAGSDGSSSVTVTLGDVSANFTAYAYLASAWRRVTIQRSDSGSSEWGNFYLGTSGTATVGYYAPGSTITMRFVRNTALDKKERPQVGSIVIGSESSLVGEDGKYSYTYTLPSGVKNDLAITASLKQTAWPVSIWLNTESIASLVARRIDIASGSVIESVTNTGNGQTIYLRSGTTAEYLALVPTAKEHYVFDKWEKSNLTDRDGNAAHVQLTKGAAATVKAVGTRSDFLITGASDRSSVCDVYMQDSSKSSAYYLKTVETNPVVVCKIKSAYADQYRVASFTIGSQEGIEPQYNAAADLYYVEVVNRTDVTVTAHVVPTHFNLTVNVSPDNKTDFGRVVITSNGQELSENGFSGRLREGSDVSIVFYEKYGGRVLQIQPSSQIAQPVQTESSIDFKMPSSDCSVSFTLGAKETYTLTVGVVNLASGEAENIPGTIQVASRTYPNVVIGATGDDGVAKTFTVYKGEEYSLVVTNRNDYLARRYAFIGWRDAGGMIPGATRTTYNILNEDQSSIALYAAYNARENGTITIEYAKKVGETITAISADEAKYLLSIDNEDDRYDETHWLVGADIVIAYTASGSAYDRDGDAYKWTPVQVDVALASDAYASPNATWDDGLLTQTGSFRMLGNMKVRLVLTETRVPGYTTMHVGLRQSTTMMGEVSIFSTEMDAYTTDSTGAKALVQKEKKAVIMAAPRPGFAFAGWFTFAEGVWTAVEGAKAVYEIDYVTSPTTTYYAQFVASTVSNVKEWNGNRAVAKTCEWQSKVYVGSQFFRLTTCRVYADAYPVTLKIYMASSPDGIFSERARTTEVIIRNQDARRLPMIRPEKYFAFRVTGYARINHVGIASSMEALK